MSYLSEVLADSPASYWKLDGDPIAAATASSNYPANPPSAARDGNLPNAWITNATQTGWLRYELSTVYAATWYKIAGCDTPSRNPKNWTFEGSNDGSSWTVLDTQTNQSWASVGAINTYPIANTTTYRYYRLNVSANSGDTYLAVGELIIDAPFPDSAGNARGAYPVGVPTFGGAAAGIGMSGTSIAVTGGAGASIDAANAGFFSGQATFSANMWFKSSSAGTLSLLSTSNQSFGGSDARNHMLLRMQDGVVQIYVGTPSGYASTSAPLTYNNGAWHMVTVTVGAGTIRLYIDGAQKATTTYSGSPNAGTGTTMRIGASNVTTNVVDSPFVGSLDEVSTYTSVLSASRIAALYDAANTAAPVTVTGTVASLLPPLTASATGTVTGPPITGTASASLAPLTAAVAGTHTSNDQVGTMAAALPPLQSSVDGTYTPATVTGDAAVTLPPLTGDVSGTVSTLGTVGATLPPLEVAVNDGSGDVAGGLGATLPPLSGEVVGYAPATAAAWTADLSQRTILPFTTAVTSPTFVPPLQAAPPNIVERPVLRESVTVPDPNTLPPASVRTDPQTGQVVIRDDVYDAFARTSSIVGVPHMIIDGRDVTYFRDVTTQVRDTSAAEPFGDVDLVVEFPQIDSLDDAGDPQLAWLRPDATVHYVMQRWDADGPTGEVTTLFHGFLVSDDTGNDENTMQTVWTARGDMYAAAMFVHQPRVITTAVDSGVQMAKALNSVTNRPYGTVAAVTTGIPTVQRGDSGGKVMAYVQRLLADATDEAGVQWTVAKKRGSMNTPEIRKKRTGRVWTVTNGQRGIELNLSTDRTQSSNVIWGRGQRSDGGVWMRKLFPDGRNAPAYPFSSPGSVMRTGTTDASTSTGNGVSTWQRRAQSLGFHVTVDGVFGSADAAVTRQLQDQYGIQVDGVVGPQTWNETFDVGALSADPDGWVRLPLAWLPGTQEFLYRANGTLIGKDPAHDPDMKIVSDDLDLGTDLTLADGIRTAKQLLARENPIPLTGEITFNSADPREGSRYDIEPGDEIRVIGYRGRTVTLYAPERKQSWQGKGPVTVQVAEKPLDALTLAQIRQRDAASRTDVSRAPGKPKPRPVIDPWDCESNAGHIERFALYGGLWTVIRFPMSEVGRITEMNVVTSVAAKYAITLFARPITSAAHIRWFGGNPSTVENPGQANREWLEQHHGLIEAWGGSNGMLGFYPFTDDGKHAPTGRAKEAGVDYWSPDGYLYCGLWADRSCFIDLDFSAAPPEA